MEHLEAREPLSPPIDERITGFIPRDRYELASTSLPSAREAFTPRPSSGEVVYADPLGNLTAKELRQHQVVIAGITRAQQAAEQGCGINPRHPR